METKKGELKIEKGKAGEMQVYFPAEVISGI
jgi:hypothetical protein